jgi:hypothetical protein
MAGIPIFSASLLLIPISLYIAIRRYRLWDIDLLVRRTSIYSALTASLGLIYFGSVISLQRILDLLTGKPQSEIVTVFSTLGIAALFGPLRRRIQNAIDKRFYRRKYDAAQVLSAFAATARDEPDLEKLADSLVGVVHETMQPKSISVWLKDSNQK